MKTRLFLMAMASVALASCVSEDVSDVKQKDEKVKIAFEAPVMYNSTESREVAGEMPIPYSKDETFTVYGLEHEGDFSSWTIGGTTQLLMNGVVVTYDATLNGWKPDTDHLWPYGKKCTFAAYSPSRANTDGTITYGSSGLKIENFTVKEALNQQYDLMYAPREYNRTTSYHAGTTYNGVPLTFKHALSSIHFALVSSHAKPITLVSISLSGLKKTATFNETITNDTPYSAEPAWSSLSGEASYTIYNDTDLSDDPNIVFPSDMKRLGNMLPEGADHGLLTIPQTLNEAKLQVVYKIEGETENTTANVDLKNYFANEWMMGTRYYYVLSIGNASSKIYFAPIVETWSTDDTIIQLQ